MDVKCIKNFPKEGVSFYDISSLLIDHNLFSCVIDKLSNPFIGKVDVVCAIESRGFIFGSCVAQKLGVGFFMARKAGKLPGNTKVVEYTSEYSTNKLEVQENAILPGQRVLIVDDVLATGGTVNACCSLIKQLGGIVSGISIVIEIESLNGRKTLPKDIVHAVQISRTESSF